MLVQKFCTLPMSLKNTPVTMEGNTRTLQDLYNVQEFRELVPDLIDEQGVTITEALSIAGYKSQNSYWRALHVDSGINGLKTIARMLAPFGIELHIYVQIKKKKTLDRKILRDS